MALRVLVVTALVGLGSPESTSHVSIAFGDQEPVSYQVLRHPHRPSAPKGDHPEEPGTVTPKGNPASAAFSPPDLTKASSPATTLAPKEASTPPHVTYRPTSEAGSEPPPASPPDEEHAPEAMVTPSRSPKKQPSHTRPPPGYRPAPSHDAAPYYYLTHAQSYNYAPAYRPAAAPLYNYVPSYGPGQAPAYPAEPAVPACAEATNATYCTEDEAYPEYEIKHAIQYHLEKFNNLYADVADLNTELSVYGPKTLDEETYLCPSETTYVRPLRALNTEGKWCVIVNKVKVHYEVVTQTARVEECRGHAECPKVPSCYESRCVQKSIYHRFLVYDPYDQYFPFAVEAFKLPASCACLLGASTLED
ncbi:uncharacterized protein LOC126983258 [Eriocheir sinensis]|uniref:uncharacterized protein LOC126983258 n=1 Tax=Eriocheir sinensis TaxID=95602 RepID=UPI0021C56916|nr:uncharacterized protein LOC126983258 [Eriocheir sinensis]